MADMRSSFATGITASVIRADLMQLSQGNDEQFQTFAARVKGKAVTCGFTTTTKCTCGRTVTADYTDEAIRDVLLSGISDADIRREAMGMDDNTTYSGLVLLNVLRPIFCALTLGLTGLITYSGG